VTTIDVNAIRRREKAATPGPWIVGEAQCTDEVDDWEIPVRMDGLKTDLAVVPYHTSGFHFPHAEAKADAEFIAAARTDVPDLLAEVDRLTAELAEAKAKLDMDCGSCHPCTNYADQTWRNANRKPPHVITWDETRDAMRRARNLADDYEVAGDTETAQRIRKALNIPDLHESLAALDEPVTEDGPR
jgi:hypothetical protein